MARNAIPALMPRLAAGAHRSPRRGACFMEFASFLAGERWSDHPDCTDPVLAALAREVNDRLPDSRRDELLVQIPRVIGLRGDDRIVGLVVALRAAAEAIPVASMERQRSLALGMQGVRHDLTARDAIDPVLERVAEAALRDAPDARRWADRYLSYRPPGSRALHPSAAETIAQLAAAGIAQACVPDPETRLIAMLGLAIEDAERAVAVPVSAPIAHRHPIAV
ncbi:MAG: hypothetical protein KF727_00300 [Microbacteriaceae bacterium]|nr:hypothetical protein [Microbacteriaceae bacterium]